MVDQLRVEDNILNRLYDEDDEAFYDDYGWFCTLFHNEMLFIDDLGRE